MPIHKARLSKYLSNNLQPSFSGIDNFSMREDGTNISTLKRSSASHKIKSGQLGEQYAVQFLTENGYKILARNEIVGKTEIDIVAQKNDEIIFTEVRTREKNKFVFPEETITIKKMSSMSKAAKLWCNKYNYSGYYRIDLVAVTLVGDTLADIEQYKSITEPII